MLKFLLRPYFKKSINFLSRHLGVQSNPLIPCAEKISGLENCVIWPTCRLICRPIRGQDSGGISLGPKTYLGRNVELAAVGNSRIKIGRNTSIQDNTILHGDIAIGEHCSFSMNIYVGSTTHRFRDTPYFLIKDQDAMIDPSQKVSENIVIEDDCWLGWGVVVLPGVYIGRGSIIGANSVVSRDVYPFTVHVGSPNREISKRLSFDPPEVLLAENNKDLPYFYKGFDVTQEALKESRALGVVYAFKEARIILKSGQFKKLIIKGIKNLQIGAIKLSVCINDVKCFFSEIDKKEILIQLEMLEGDKTMIPSVLKPYNIIDISVENLEHDEYTSLYGISLVQLQ